MVVEHGEEMELGAGEYLEDRAGQEDRCSHRHLTPVSLGFPPDPNVLPVFPGTSSSGPC